MRLSNVKHTFKKGYLPNWTKELFTVVKCIETRPPVYLVKDDHGEILEGTFYAEEIQRVIKQNDVYKIQRVLRCVMPIFIGRSIERQDGEDYKRRVSGYFLKKDGKEEEYSI